MLGKESVVLVGNGSELISFLQEHIYAGVFQTEPLLYLADLLLKEAPGFL